MNVFKRLFNSNDSKDISTNEKIQKNIVQESEQPSIDDVEQKSFTEEETNELIERFVKYGDNFESFDPLVEDAMRLLGKKQYGSPSNLQIKLKLGSNRSSLLIKQLILIGIVKPIPPNNYLVNGIFKSEAEVELFIQNEFYKTDYKTFYNEYVIEIEKRKQEHQERKQQQQIQYEKNLIKQELLQNEHRKQIRTEAYKELVSQGLISNQLIDREGRRETIPQNVMDSVWNRDGGRCTKCGSQENLEFDHIIPFSKGGANTYRNLQILCKKCNIEKSNKIG